MGRPDATPTPSDKTARSLVHYLSLILRDAESAHKVHLTVHPAETDWVPFYAAYIATRLQGIVTGLQGKHVTADNVEVPQFQARVSVQPDIVWEVDGDTNQSYPVQVVSRASGN